MNKVFLSIVAFLGLSAGKNLNVTIQDNPLLTCYTNPCVNVDGFGKIMGTKKVSQCGLWKVNIFSDTQIFREINLRNFLKEPFYQLPHSEDMNLDFYAFLHL